MSKFSRVCERRKPQVNVSKDEVIGCSRYVNIMTERKDLVQLDEVKDTDVIIS